MTDMNTSTEPWSAEWRPLVLAVSVMTGACGVHRVQVSGPMPLRARPTYAIEIDPRTIRSATIRSHGGLPDVVIPDVPEMLRATLGAAPTDSALVVRVQVSSIDVESTEAGEEVLAAALGAEIVRTHGTAGTPKTATPRTPHYVRIKFVGELRRGDAPVGRVRGTVSGDVRVGASEETIREAIGSAIDKLLVVLERALVAQHTASASIDGEVRQLPSAARSQRAER